MFMTMILITAIYMGFMVNYVNDDPINGCNR
jgi:hypothetical protein